MDFNKLAKEIHEHNVSVGWWDGEQARLETKLMLVITEIAEATEGERKGLMDDHLPHRKMGEVELADALIRMLDIGGRLGLNFEDKGDWVCTSNIYEEHLWLVDCVIRMATIISRGISGLNSEYSYFIKGILSISETQGYDVISAMYEKLEYNKTRTDHKLENRMKEGGKKV